MKKLLLILLALAWSTAADADSIVLGQLSFGGNGCPQGTVSATLGTNKKSLGILFEKYQVAVGRPTGKSFDRKTCNLAIPIHVPQGQSVSILATGYRGFIHLPVGATAVFNAENFFAGGRGPIFKRSFSGLSNRSFSITNQLTADAVVWSGCGADVILRTNSSIRLSTPADREANASVKLSAAIVYHLQWRTCH